MYNLGGGDPILSTPDHFSICGHYVPLLPQVRQ